MPANSRAAKNLALKLAKKGKMQKVMHEYKKSELHSGSKKGPMVTSRKQAIAIGLSEAKQYMKKTKKVAKKVAKKSKGRK